MSGDPELVAVECWQCGGEGVIEGECTCGESCCCCLDPEPPCCDLCQGEGILMVTPECAAANDGPNHIENVHKSTEIEDEDDHTFDDGSDP